MCQIRGRTCIGRENPPNTGLPRYPRFERLRIEVTMASRKVAIRVGAIIGAVVAAVPAIPVAWIGVVFSFGDHPHPIAGVVSALFFGLFILAAGALVGGIIGAIVAGFSKQPPGE